MIMEIGINVTEEEHTEDFGWGKILKKIYALKIYAWMR